MTIDGALRDIEEDADFVIVGSGASGATCARWLSAAGCSVVVLEEGAPAKVGKGDGLDAMSRLYRSAGAAMTVGKDRMALLQGRCVGGSTVVAGGIQSGLPEAVWREWVARDARWAQRLPWEALEMARERMDAELSVHKTPRELWGETGAAFFRALPGQASPTWRNTPGCQGSGRCLQGCPHRGKTSADLSLLPQAEQYGARIYARCKVERILMEGHVAKGVRGRFESGKLMTARARKAVILATSPIHTPWLLLQSGLRNVGQGWRCHPRAVLTGLFHKPVHTGPAASLAMESVVHGAADVHLQTLELPRSWAASRVPGLGPALASRLEQMDHIAVWGSSVRAEATGSIRRGPWGPRVHYETLRKDRVLLLKSLAVLAEAMLQAGAMEVWPGIDGAPEVVTSVKQARELALIDPAPGLTQLFATDFFGGVAVDERFQVEGVSGLVVADASLLPTSTGVSPMSTIMAVATIVAERWAAA